MNWFQNAWKEQNFNIGENTGGRIGRRKKDILDKIQKVLTKKGC